MTAPWETERRYHRPDARRTAGLTFDDIQPGPGDDAELKRSLRAVDQVYEEMYQLGRTSRPCPPDANRWEEASWWQGRYDRNRHRQEVAWAWTYRAVKWLRGHKKAKPRKAQRGRRR